MLYKSLNKKDNFICLPANGKSFLINYNKIKSYGYKELSVKESILKFIKDNKIK